MFSHSSVLFFRSIFCRPLILVQYFLHLGMTTCINYPYNNKAVYGIKSDASRYDLAGYYLFILISSLVGDTIILIASLKYRAFNFHKLIVVTIQHIAFCDLMVTTTNVIPRIVSLICDKWVFGNSLCYLTAYTGYYFNSVSLLLICIMTTSKLLLLKYPFLCETISVKKANMFCGACWLIALSLPVAALLVAALD